MPDRAKNSSSKRTARLVFGGYVAVATAFVVHTTAQVAISLFGGEASAKEIAQELDPKCAGGLKELESAVGTAITEAIQEPDRREALQRYEASKAQAWKRYPEIAHACEATPGGREALASLARLDRAAQGSVQRDAEKLGRVRREVDSFIR